MRKVIACTVVVSFLLQPLGLVTPILAEEVRMEYTDPDHVHAPKVVNGVTCEYDANGNLVGDSDGERRIDWNQDNLPTKITKGDVEVKFYYGANGQRIAKEVKNVTTGETISKTTYVNQYYQEETSPQGTASTKYYFANGRIAVRNTPSGGESTLTFLHQDHLGSTVLATDSDSQKITDPLSYFPYGSSINNQQLTISNYLFTGQELDPESDLYNYNARLYNPRTGTFISADSVGGGNKYAYAVNNPMMFVDPSGNQVNVWYWLTKIIMGGGKLGTSVSSGTFWAGALTWVSGLYAEAVTTYQKETGMIVNPVGVLAGQYYPVAGCDVWGACPISEEQYESQMETAETLQQIGLGTANVSARLYIASAVTKGLGETLHPGSVDPEKVMEMNNEIAEQYDLNIEYDEGGELGFGVGGGHNYDPETGVSTVTGPLKLSTTIHEDFHAWLEQSGQMGIPTRGGDSVMSGEQWYTEYLPLAMQNEQAANAAASRYMFSKGGYLYGLLYDLHGTLVPISYYFLSVQKYPDYWVRKILGPIE